MASLDKLIDDLVKIEENLNDTIDKTLMNNESNIIKVLQDRLFTTGINGIGNKLREYKDATKIKKIDHNLPYTITTLFEAGDFYSAMFLFSKDATVQISSTDWKRDKLVKKYGGNIFQLLPEEQVKLVPDYLEPKIKSILPKYDVSIKYEI